MNAIHQLNLIIYMNCDTCYISRVLIFKAVCRLHTGFSKLFKLPLSVLRFASIEMVLLDSIYLTMAPSQL